MKKFFALTIFSLALTVITVSTTQAQSSWNRAEACAAIDVKLSADVAGKSVADSAFHIASGDTLGFTLNKLYYGNVHLVKINKSLAGSFTLYYGTGATAASQSVRKTLKYDATYDAPADLNGVLFSGWKASNYYVEFNGIKVTLE
jgi:hypothetical protein